jgi:hypothetical protein
LYDLLIASLDKRRAAMDKKAQKMQTHNDYYCSGSVNVISQHCILFAPNFDKPILQPPVPQK